MDFSIWDEIQKQGYQRLGFFTGAAETLWGGKPSKRQKELEARLKFRMEHGLTNAERADIAGKYAPQISRAAAIRQRNLARAYASSGGTGSSEMMGQIGAINQVGDVLPGIMSQYDIEVRRRAEAAYNEFEMALDEQRQSAIEHGASMMMGGMGTTNVPQNDNPQIDMSKYMNALMPVSASSNEGLYHELYQGDQIEGWEGTGWEWDPVTQSMRPRKHQNSYFGNWG